jgi:hypothetical protein
VSRFLVLLALTALAVLIAWGLVSLLGAPP